MTSKNLFIMYIGGLIVSYIIANFFSKTYGIITAILYAAHMICTTLNSHDLDDDDTDDDSDD